jgi:hypothetical protein
MDSLARLELCETPKRVGKYASYVGSGSLSSVSSFDSFDSLDFVVRRRTDLGASSLIGETSPLISRLSLFTGDERDPCNRRL